METVRTSISLYGLHGKRFRKLQKQGKLNRVIRRWIPHLRANLINRKGVTIGYQWSSLAREGRAKIFGVTFDEDVYLELGMIRAGTRVSASKMVAWILDRHFENRSQVNYQTNTAENLVFERKIGNKTAYHAKTHLKSRKNRSYNVTIRRIS